MKPPFLDLEQQPKSVSVYQSQIACTYIMRPSCLSAEFSGFGECEGLRILSCIVQICQQGLHFSIGVPEQSPQIRSRTPSVAVPSYFFFSFTGLCARFDCCSMSEAKRSQTSQLLLEFTTKELQVQDVRLQHGLFSPKLLFRRGRM